MPETEEIIKIKNQKIADYKESLDKEKRKKKED